ncbi:MAG: sensor histidine kinase [Spirochaetia bacterium]
MEEKQMKILIVEDEAMVSELVKRQVMNIGYTVIGVAYDRYEAVKQAEELKPDLILMDLQMTDPETGDTDRLAGLKATRAIQKLTPCPVVLLTAHESPELTQKASEVGVGAYLVKPARENDIDRAVAIAKARFEDMLRLEELNTKLEDTNRQLQTAVSEKDLLLKEVHRRVKNNLQIISSMLGIQSGAVEDEEARTALLESKDRINSMAIIHEKLYQESSISAISFKNFVSDLISQLFQSYAPAGVTINLEVDNTEIETDKAISCGLILNELVSNAIKHGLADQEKGTVTISFTSKNHEYVLSVLDTGKGLPEGFDIEDSQSMGLSMVNLLVTGNLEGSMEACSTDNGAQIVIHIPLSKEVDADI